MTFVQAIFLFGIAGVAGPIAAHLLARPRYRRVPFTMMRFLQAGESESHARRRMRNVFVLALRCAIIALVALLFAGPERLLAHTDGPAAVRIAIGIDDSLSMAADDALDTARNAAKDAIAHAPEGAVYFIDGLASGRALSDASRTEATVFVDQMAPVAGSMSVTGWLGRLRDLRGADGAPLHAKLISDFTPQVREAMDRAEGGVAVDAFDRTIVAHDLNAESGAVTAVDVSPGADRQLLISAALTNYCDAEIEGHVTARLGGNETRSAPIRLGPREQRNVPLHALWPEDAPEHVQLEVAFKIEDALTEDNRRYVGLSLTGPRSRRVAVFASDAREGHLLQSAFSALAKHSTLGSLTVQHFLHGELRPSTIAGADAIVFASPPSGVFAAADELAAFVRGGGRLVAFVDDSSSNYYEKLWDAGVLPGIPLRYLESATTLAAAFGSATMGDALSENGDTIRALRNYRLDALPIHGHYAIERDSDSEVLWEYASGEAFVAYRKMGSGATVLVNTSADDSLSPLMKSPAAVAFAQYLIGGTGRLDTLAFDAGKPAALPVSDLERDYGQGSDRVGVTAPSGARISAVLSGGSLAVPAVNELGWLKTESKPVRYAGLNVPEGESDLSAPQETSLDLALARLFIGTETEDAIGDAVETPETREPWWPAVGWAALALIVVELFVSNRMAR